MAPTKMRRAPSPPAREAGDFEDSGKQHGPPAKKVRSHVEVQTSAPQQQLPTFENFPCDVLSLILGYCTSVEMGRLSVASNRIKKVAECVAERIVREESRRAYWGLIAGDLNIRPWVKLLERMEKKTRKVFFLGYQRWSLEVAAALLRNGLGRDSSLASFGRERENSSIIRTGWGGYVSILGGMTPKKCLFARAERGMASGNFRFVVRIGFPGGIGERDNIHIGIVNEDYDPHNLKNCQRGLTTIFSKDGYFLRAPRVEESEGNEVIFGLTVDTDKTFVFMDPIHPSTVDGVRGLGNERMKGPLFVGIRVERDRISDDDRAFYGAADIAIRECSDNGWDALLERRQIVKASARRAVTADLRAR